MNELSDTRPGMCHLYFRHFTVTRGEKPCVLLVSSAHAPQGVLVPCVSEEPTLFLCEGPYPTIYARRRAFRAIQRTMKFEDAHRGSIADQHPFIARVLSATGPWAILPCKKRPNKSSPSSK